MQQDTPEPSEIRSQKPQVWSTLERMTTRGENIAARMERMGISQSELAKLAEIDRGALRRALDDKPSTSPRTWGRVERTLDQLEHELGMDDDAPGRVTSTVSLPTGERVTFTGDAAGVAEAATRFLAERHANGGGVG